MNQNDNISYTEDIDLRELIMAVWRKKVMIICIALIAAILTGVFSIFAITPVYHANLNIVINMPELYHTKYGDYTLPITTNQQYISQITSNNVLINTMDSLKDMGYATDGMTIEDLSKRITMDSVTTAANVEQNSFTIRVAANNPVEARDFAKALYDNYIEFLDVQTAEGAVDYYYNQYSVEVRTLSDQLVSTQEILQKNKELLADTPQTINQKEAMDEVKAGTSDFVILENVINPNYTQIELNIIENKQMIYTTETSISTYNQYLEELQDVKNTIAKYYETGEYDELEANIVSVSKTSVYLPSQPIAPSHKTSPSNAKNVIIGTFLGGIIGLFIALFQWWWADYNKKSK